MQAFTLSGLGVSALHVSSSVLSPSPAQRGTRSASHDRYATGVVLHHSDFSAFGAIRARCG
ncbi:MAG: hypothetical protein Q8902_03380 [Bacteroidota bacterium]|nr:hypothetical protein [Bacteroidota bacterium]MDP4232481.1 hypothetical protein [Bacteroidota bacterium]MDP4241616.1 hypothetical protein [Bacteroidota bacterium]